MQAQLTMHALVCAVLYTVQRSKYSAQKSRILALEGEGKFMLIFFGGGLISPNQDHRITDHKHLLPNKFAHVRNLF